MFPGRQHTKRTSSRAMTEIQGVTRTTFIVAEYRAQETRNKIRSIAIRLFRCFSASGRGKQPIALRDFPPGVRGHAPHALF